MKTVITAAIIAATSTVAMANNPVWSTTVSGLSPMCDFVANGSSLNGTMTYNEATSTFTSATAPVVKVKTRGKNNLQVTHANLVGDNQTQAVTVDYSSSTLTKGNTSFPITANPDSTPAGAGKGTLTTSGNNQAGTYTLTIAGTATHDANTVVIDNKTYTITHTVACIQ